jgi:tetratricopeptide (TPR) repeat protein
VKAFCIWVTGLSCVSASTLALAEATAVQQNSVEERERALLDEGYALRKLGKDVEALSKYQQALALRGDARALAQVALAEVALADWVHGYTHLKQALQQAEHPWIRTNRELLENELDRVAKMTATLELEVTPPGAQLRIGGHLIGVAPLSAPVRLNPGALSLEVSLARYATYRRALQLEPGRGYREVVHLVHDVMPEPSRQPPAATPNEPASWAAHRNPVWIGVALGGAMLSVSALVPWAIANQRVRDLQAECQGQTTCNFEAGNRAVHRLDVLTNALLFSGIGIASACTTLYVAITKEPVRTGGSASTESKSVQVGFRGQF